MELNKIHFSQNLPVSFEEEIQELFFFHPDQKNYRKRILKSIEKYGVPELIKRSEGVSIYLKGNTDIQQTLFVQRNSNIGSLIAIVILIKKENQINIAHFVLKKTKNQIENEQTYNEVFYGLTRMLSHIKGIDTIGLAYSETKISIKKLTYYLA